MTQNVCWAKPSSMVFLIVPVSSDKDMVSRLELDKFEGNAIVFRSKYKCNQTFKR